MTNLDEQETFPSVGAKVLVYRSAMDRGTAAEIFRSVLCMDCDIQKLVDDGRTYDARELQKGRNRLARHLEPTPATVLSVCNDGYIFRGNWAGNNGDGEEIRVPAYASLDAVLKEIEETDDPNRAKDLRINLSYTLNRSGWARYYRENPGSHFKPCVMVEKDDGFGGTFPDLVPTNNIVSVQGLAVEGGIFPKKVVEALIATEVVQDDH